MTVLPSDPALRATGLGGTDIARILGMSRFGGPMSVFMEKRGLSAPLIETSRMKWGKLLEEPVAQQYAVHSGRKVRRAAAFLRHPAYDYLFANIDRESLLGGTKPRVLEVKTADVFAAADFGEQDTDQVPDEYLIQGMHYIDVKGWDRCDFAVLIGGNREWYGSIERNPELIEVMHEESEKFWRDTEQGIPPAIDGTEASAKYLALTYQAKGGERAVDDELERLAYEYLAINAALKETETNKETVGNAIRALMGDDVLARKGALKVTWSAVKGRTAVDWPAVVGELSTNPGPVIAKHTTEGPPGRQLRVTIKED